MSGSIIMSGIMSGRLRGRMTGRIGGRISVYSYVYIYIYIYIYTTTKYGKVVVFVAFPACCAFCFPGFFVFGVLLAFP
jgi:hypothetical protein